MVTTAKGRCNCGEQEIGPWSAITDNKWKMHRRTNCYDRRRPEAATDAEWQEVLAARSADEMETGEDFMAKFDAAHAETLVELDLARDAVFRLTERVKAQDAAVKRHGLAARRLGNVNAAVVDLLRAARAALLQYRSCKRCAHTYAQHSGHTYSPPHPESHHCSRGDGCMEFEDVFPHPLISEIDVTLGDSRSAP